MLLIWECLSDFYLLLSSKLNIFKNMRCPVSDVGLYLPGIPGGADVGSAGDLRANAVGKKSSHSITSHFPLIFPLLCKSSLQLQN